MIRVNVLNSYSNIVVYYGKFVFANRAFYFDFIIFIRDTKRALRKGATFFYYIIAKKLDDWLDDLMIGHEVYYACLLSLGVVLQMNKLGQ